MEDLLEIAGKKIASRLFLGTGKFTDYALIPQVIKASRTQVVTVALRRVDYATPQENMLEYIPKDLIMMPNTSGARNAGEADRKILV